MVLFPLKSETDTSLMSAVVGLVVGLVFLFLQYSE